LCQRYHCEQMAHAESVTGGGFMIVPVYFPVEMRVIPTVANISAGSQVGANANALIPANKTSAYFQINVTSANGYVLARLDAYSAEL